MSNVSVIEAAELLIKANNILIITHRRPDGDTTGSAGALCRALCQIGKNAYILQNPDITKRYKPLIELYKAAEDFIPDFIVTTDIADINLFTPNAQKYIDKIDLVLDHHKSNSNFGKYNLIRENAGACGEVILDVIEHMGASLTTDIAECIYIALSTDTGCFKFSNTTPDTLKGAAKCLEAGVDGGEINRILFEIKTWPRFQMERIIFDTMKFENDKKVAIAKLYRKDIDNTGADMDDLDSIASLTRQLEGVEVGITLTENKDGSIKASVRTTKEVDASAICAKCGGGGHSRAAGASFEPDINMEKAYQMIVNATMEVYKETNG